MGNFKPIGWTQYPEVIRDYPAALAASLQTRFWSLLARGESQTVLFSKAILLAGGKIAQIGTENQFFGGAIQASNLKALVTGLTAILGVKEAAIRRGPGGNEGCP
jgi:hypothetical protein